MATLLAMHAALAHSPDLVRYLPDRLIKPPATCPSRLENSVLTPGQCPGGTLRPPAFSGCGATGHVELPILTDTLYEEVESEEHPSGAPADALKCLPRDNGAPTLTDRRA